MTREEAIDIIKCLAWHTRPNEEDIEQAIKALEQEPCEDAINRQAVLDEAFEVDTKEYGRIEVVGVDAIDALPSVNPQEPKTGHWIEGKYKDTCDKCRCTYPKNIGFKNYCPNCGSRMVEPQESEEVSG